MAEWEKFGCASTCCCDLDMLCITTSNFNAFLTHTIEGCQPIRNRVTYNSNACMNYAHRNSDNGCETTTACLCSVNLSCNAGNDGAFFIVEYTLGVCGQEALSLGQMVARAAPGSTAPSREEHVFKWDQTSVITRKDITNDNSGNWGNCNITVGHGTD